MMLRVNILLVWQVSKGKNEILDDCANSPSLKALISTCKRITFQPQNMVTSFYFTLCWQITCTANHETTFN